MSYRLLYIGEDLMGTTSEYRLRVLEKFLKTDAIVVDFNQYLSGNRLIRSFQWRLQEPKLLSSFNRELQRILSSEFWDLIWMDKGMFVSQQSMELISRRGKQLVFFTPDTLFWENSSRFIHSNLHRFDVVATTKSFELEMLLRYVERQKILILNQGFSITDMGTLRPFNERSISVGFVGKFEHHRGFVVKGLLESGLSVHVAGAGWKQFARKQANSGLKYLGESLRGQDYRDFYLKTKIGLGLLSKQFPELHTTRTFEIPYFGALLASEGTAEVRNYFDDSNALLYSSISELAEKIKVFLQDDKKCETCAMRGRQAVLEAQLSWNSQVIMVLNRVGFKELMESKDI